MITKWTADEFWQYVGGLAGEWEAGEMRRMMTERGLTLAPSRPETAGADEEHPDCTTARECELYDALMGIASHATANYPNYRKWSQGGLVLAPVVARALRLAGSELSPQDGAAEGKAKAALAYLIEHVEYSDSYGVEGSSFMACHLCNGGGAPGIPLEHAHTCPVARCEAVGAEWWSESIEDVKDARSEAIEECAKIAEAIDSRRGNEREIAKAIRALALPRAERSPDRTALPACAPIQEDTE